jgi:predicted CoA-binding protein
MKPGEIITDDDKINQLLKKYKTIAVLGLSPKPERDSHRVADYMKTQGYRIIPVRPGQSEILGEKAYATLDDIKEPIDIVNVFRNPDQVLAHAHEAIRLKPKVFWMQLDIENSEAATLLTAAGIDVIMDRCIKIEHGKLRD